VRGTFDMDAAGNLKPAEAQEDVRREPEYLGEPGRSSLRYDTDLVRSKLRTDVLLHGSAHAPGEKPASHVDVHLSVGPISKHLRVWGDRVWKLSPLGPKPSAPEPFTRLPITYERAYGGSAPPDAPQPLRQEARNPVGVGLFPSEDEPVPNVEYPGHPAGAAGWARPAGFGPIPPSWSPRRELAGTFDAAWEQRRMPLLPLDFQEGHFQCAPEDQQAPGLLRGGEDVLLEGLTPSGVWRFQLPRVPLGFRTRINGGTVDHRANVHTVILEPDARRITLVWQTALPCHDTLYSLEQTTVYEKVQL
jgi:hypothetical protein